MKKIRYILSIWLCKILIFAGKLGGKKGSSTPGIYALRVCPDVLKILSKKVKKEIITICGTNGKTTTNNIIYKVLTDKGNKVICNNVGANMLPGVVTAFIKEATILGNLDADYATIEVDEASAQKVFKHFSPDIMVITNLFRDQLDRYGDIVITAKYLKNALDLTKDTKVIVNGDDPFSSSIGLHHKNFISFGILEDAKMNIKEETVNLFCPVCSGKLNYNFYHYSHLGDFKCEKCDFKRPELNYYAKDVEVTDKLAFTVNGNIRIDVGYRGFYNIYNILSAIAVLDTLKIDLKDINDILKSYKPQIGRMEKFNLSKPTVLNLSKNPAGFNQAIYTILADKNDKDLIIVLNDNAQDGKDVSWLWDVEFEKLNDPKIVNIGFAGIRKRELSLRFKYADTGKNCKIFADAKEAIDTLLKTKSNSLYLLVNYTAIFDVQSYLKELEGNK